MTYKFAYVIFFVYLCTRKGLEKNMTTLTHSEKEAIMKDMKSFDAGGGNLLVRPRGARFLRRL